MSLRQLIPSFNAGELSPYLNGRSDLEKYASGCRVLENFVILPYGGAYRRPGTEYLGTAKYADKRCRLLGFNFSTTTSFVLELGHLYVRFWSNGVPVIATDAPLELATPYSESELRDVQFIQINDVMFFVHPAHPPRKMSRIADDNWTFEEIAWDWPALLDENITATTITPSATTGAITLTASAALFDPGHVGSYWQLAHIRSASYVDQPLTANGNSASITALGSWELTTYGIWSATLQLQRSEDNGATWEIVNTYKSAGDRNVSATGKEDKECLLRLAVLNWVSTSGSTPPRALLEMSEAKEFGIVKVTGVTDSTHANATVVNGLQSTGATKYWSEGAWSTRRGFPRTVSLHEQRIFYAGTSSRPQTIWGSFTDDYQNLRIGTNDDSGLSFTIAAEEANPIQWMLSQDSLLIGTAGEEWTVGTNDTESAITPTNIRVRRWTKFGSKYLRALLVNDVALFTQRQGRKVRELVYSAEKTGWVAVDLTMLSEHVTKGKILEHAFAQQPDAIYWTVTGEGQLVGMTYERQQNVVGWHRHTTQGVFESVATIYGTNDDEADEVWLAVQRQINGQTVRYIERFRPDFREVFEAENKPSYWYLDCAKRVVLTPEGRNVIGLNHLEGMAVDILADGAVAPGKVVSGGQVTLQEPASVVLAGLRYESHLSPMGMEAMLQNGTTRGLRKRAHQIVASFYKSMGGEYTTDGETWDLFYFRKFEDPQDSSPPPFTGDKDVYTGSEYKPNITISLRQTQPLPMTILAIVAKWDAYGD